MDDEKFYAYLQARNVEKDALDENRLHHQLAEEHFTGTITGILEAVTYLHVGTGELLRPKTLTPPPSNASKFELAAPFFRQTDANGYTIRVIPGSSFRGVIRSLVEAFTDSGFGVSGRDMPSYLQESRYSDQEMKVASPPHLDPTSQLFGGQGYASHVQVQDLHTEASESWELIRVGNRWSPKVRAEDDRKIYLHQKDYNQGEEILEVCPPGTLWNFVLPFQNLPTGSLGVLLTALGQHPNYPLYPKLGGGKGQGIGSGKILDVQVQCVDAKAAYLHYTPTFAPLSQQELQDCFTQAEASYINMAALQQLHDLIGALPT